MSKNLKIWVIKNKNILPNYLSTSSSPNLSFMIMDSFRLWLHNYILFLPEGLEFCLVSFFFPKPRIILHFCSNRLLLSLIQKPQQK